MTERHPDEVILARWTVDPPQVREFTRRVRARYGDSAYSPSDLLKACEEDSRSGVEVVCRDDAVFVGRWCLAFLYNGISAIRLEEEWILFVMEGGEYDLQVPVARNGRAEAARMVDYYTRKGEEEVRRAIQERQAPTLSNRLLNIVEPHFVWVLLGLFFVAIPLVVFLVSLLNGGLR